MSSLCQSLACAISNSVSEPQAGQKEILTSWALLILIVLLIVALLTSYVLQTRKIQAVHETVISIFAGMSDQENGRDKRR